MYVPVWIYMHSLPRHHFGFISYEHGHNNGFYVYHDCNNEQRIRYDIKTIIQYFQDVRNVFSLYFLFT